MEKNTCRRAGAADIPDIERIRRYESNEPTHSAALGKGGITKHR